MNLIHIELHIIVYKCSWKLDLCICELNDGESLISKSSPFKKGLELGVCRPVCTPEFLDLAYVFS